MQTYIYGNTVRKEQSTSYIDIQEDRKEFIRYQRELRVISLRYVLLLTFSAFFLLFTCVSYLKLQTDVYNQSQTVSNMESTLLYIKEDNSARSTSIMSGINLVEIKDKAMNEFGMIYPIEGQIIEYESGNADMVRQYHEIPESGIIVGSN